MIENLFPATRSSPSPLSLLSLHSLGPRDSHEIDISKRRVYHRRDEYEILTGETEREGGGRFGTRLVRRKRGRKGWAQPPPRWLPPRPTSLLSRQVYDEPTQTRHLAANWPPSYRSLAFFLPPIPSPVWNPTAHSLVLPTHSVHRCASERDLSATIRNPPLFRRVYNHLYIQFYPATVRFARRETKRMG